MQFSATWQDVLAGRKTMTRRVWKPGDEPVWLMADGTVPVSADSNEPPDAVVRGGRLQWVAGRTYAVQPGRGKHAVGRILVTAIRYCARAGDISEADARAEGFETAEEFRAVYARLNGAGAPDAPCWALLFAMCRSDYRDDENLRAIRSR